MTKAGWRRNFWELKELLLTQCKETKNFEKRIWWNAYKNSLEKNLYVPMDLKTTTRELREIYTSFKNQSDKAEERRSEVEDQIDETKLEGKIREKRVKEMIKASKKYGIMWKDLIYLWEV